MAKGRSNTIAWIHPAEFVGKTVVISGGAKGAGGAATRRFQAGGATVMTAACTDRPDFVPSGLFVHANLARPMALSCSLREPGNGSATFSSQV